jgi:hypothetical protein
MFFRSIYKPAAEEASTAAQTHTGDQPEQRSHLCPQLPIPTQDRLAPCGASNQASDTSPLLLLNHHPKHQLTRLKPQNAGLSAELIIWFSARPGVCNIHFPKLAFPANVVKSNHLLVPLILQSLTFCDSKTGSGNRLLKYAK